MRNKLTALTILLISFATSIAALVALAPAARASSTQVAMFESDTEMYNDPVATLNQLRSLGVGVVRVNVPWDKIYANGDNAFTRPSGFNGADPRSPQYAFGQLDQIVADGPRYGITIDLSVAGGAPIWATGGGKPAGGRYPEWRPSASEYGKFVQALATRYNGTFRPTPGSAALPAVRDWEIWNEPNFGPDLAPQSTNRSSISTSPAMYRGLVDAAWSALTHTGHARDTVILGNLDARGLRAGPTRKNPDGYPGNFSATKPLAFIRTLYCVDGRLRALRGRAAAALGCPSTAQASRRFRAQHPGLFAASSFGDHPYPFTAPPNRVDSRDPDCAELTEIPKMTRLLDRLQGVYGSRHRFAIWNNEFGYITNPPNHSQRFPSPALAATYMNWAEYISYQNPRLVSSMQFLLTDPNPRQAPEYGGFASGLFFFGGRVKPAFDAYRLPLYLPSTTVRRGRSVLVWGCARPSHAYGQRRVVVQFRSGRRGAFKPITTMSVRDIRGYFETHVRLNSSGAIRLAWAYPAGPTVYSRTVTVTVR